MQKFDWADPFLLDDQLEDDERMIRDSIRQWVSDRFMPVIEEHNRNATFPTHLIPELGELGVYGASLTGYGCAGLSPIASGLICQELERGDSGLRSFVSVQGSLCMYPIWAYGTEEQKQRYLPKMATGVVPSKKVTVPSPIPVPGGFATTVAVIVTDWPKTVGVSDDVTVVVVSALKTC